MEKLQKTSRFAIFYTAWIGSILLFLWFIVISRETWLAVLRNYWARGLFARTQALNILDLTYILLIGLAWIIFIVVIESYFRTGANRGSLLPRVGKVYGAQVLAIFLIDLAMMAMVGPSALPWTKLAIMAIELLAGCGLSWFAWRAKPNPADSIRLKRVSQKDFRSS